MGRYVGRRKMDNNSQNKMRRTTIWIENEQRKLIRENMEKANAANESEYIRMAIDFYSGYIKTDKAEKYLLNTFSSVLHSTIEMSEERIIKYVYKMAVEQAVLNRIIGIENRMTEQEFEDMLEAAQREVKEL